MKFFFQIGWIWGHVLKFKTVDMFCATALQNEIFYYAC